MTGLNRLRLGRYSVFYLKIALRGVVAWAGAWKLACIGDFSGILLEYLLQALYAIEVD